ncbi:MAG: hypothetical protein JNJ57_16715, partial [Saprospiraceae bacterium]|nr:hypothetical protein [Saprospiraceae bacterium]
MIDSKVVESIRALSSEDKEGFDQFLLSPYFQKGFSVNELRTFFHYIIAALDAPHTTSFSKENVYELLFPAKPFSQSRMDRIMFELNRLVQVFLQIKTYLKRENEVQRLLDWSIYQRKGGNQFPYEKQLQKTWAEIEALDLSLTEGFFKSYQTAKENHEWLSSFNRVKGDLGIPKVLHYLDLFYYTQKLELLNRYQLQQKATLITPSETIQRDLFTFKIPEHYTREHPELTILEKIHELFQPEVPSPNGFRELMDMLAVLENRLTAEELFQVYAYLRSYCAILIDAGFAEFNVILHEI